MLDNMDLGKILVKLYGNHLELEWLRGSGCTVRDWIYRLAREAVAAPSLEVFKARLDGALSSLG